MLLDISRREFGNCVQISRRTLHERSKAGQVYVLHVGSRIGSTMINKRGLASRRSGNLLDA